MSSDTSRLKVAIEEPRAWSRRLSITVPADRVARTRRSVADGIARTARLPGFRKGKLPTRVIEQRFGPSIQQETLDRLIQDSYREALQSEGLTPITQGTVENIRFAPDSDLEFDVEFEVQPEIQLARIGGFTATRPTVTVGDEDVESVLERLRDERAEWDPIEGERPEFGDRALVEILPLDDSDERKAGEEPRKYKIELGGGQAIPDVEAAIMTLAPGEQGEFSVSFPEDFPEEERRGETQRLRIRMLEAQRKKLPEVDDAFAKQVGDFEDLSALRAAILEDLKRDAEQQAEADVRRQLLGSVIEANPFEVPESLIERYLGHMIGHPHEPGEAHDHSPEEEERLRTMRQALRPQAEQNVKRMLVIDRIADQEGLRATQDEIDERIERLAERHGRSPSQVWIDLEKAGQLEVLEREITEEKVFDHLKAQNAVA